MGVYVYAGTVFPISFSPAEIIILVAGGAILPPSAVPASTRISARLKRVQNTVHP